ncbi:MAG: hypothetical protein J6I85_02725 [Clostridia bacterium]|nr:hypothetical protein [Clostridia bacterium]MBP3800935.1 hypothetical protein [Clostridia bacterium]
MSEDEKIEILGFLAQFGCAKISQLQILFNKPNNNMKEIINTNFVSKKGDILIHNHAVLDKKMISAIDILCQYKGRYAHYHRGVGQVYITFITKENLLYNIIVTDKGNEDGLLRLLKIDSPAIPEADRLYLLFEDDACLNKIECKLPYAYCLYPEIKILNRKKVDIKPNK